MNTSCLLSAPATAFVGLGSNLHQPVAQLELALNELGRLPKTRLVARSSLYRSAPVGFTEQPDFVNAVAQLETELGPDALLAALLDIEHKHGRVRHFVNGPRPLDLDLLIHGETICHRNGLTLPHPRMHERAFVLQPLVEIAEDCCIPGQGVARTFLQYCGDQYIVPLKPEDSAKQQLEDQQ